MKMRTLVAAAAVRFTMLLAEGVAAAEIKVLSVVPLKTSLDELGPQFERATGHKLMITYDGSSGLKRRFDASEAFDVALIYPELIDALLKQGKLFIIDRDFSTVPTPDGSYDFVRSERWLKLANWMLSCSSIKFVNGSIQC